MIYMVPANGIRPEVNGSGRKYTVLEVPLEARVLISQTPKFLLIVSI